MTDTTTPERKRRGIALPVVIAGAASSLLLAFSMTPTFSALTASIQNTINTAGTGSLGMQETGPDASGTQQTCTTTGSVTSVSCSTINKYGGKLNMKAGDSQTTSVTIKNIGSLPATGFSILPGACTQSNNGAINGTGDLCGKLVITVKVGSTTILTGSPTTINGTSVDILNKLSVSSIATNASTVFDITVSLPSTPDPGNAIQGLAVSQPITFTFGA